jgi:hypothetical protein
MDLMERLVLTGNIRELVYNASDEFLILIEAMLLGKWKCTKCKHIRRDKATAEYFCFFTGVPAPDPCSSWKPKEE